MQVYKHTIAPKQARPLISPSGSAPSDEFDLVLRRSTSWMQIETGAA